MEPGTGNYRFPFLRPHPVPLTSLVSELAEVEASGTYTNFGPQTRRVEDLLVERLFDGSGHCVTTVNATIALMIVIRRQMAPGRHLALLPSFTFSAPAQAAVWNGMSPLFCDIEPDTWLPSAASEIELLDAYRDQIGIVIAHATFGNCPDLDHYTELSRFYDVPVVVDAAPALGTRDVDGRQFGSGAIMPVVFSMHATKTFATAEGGVIYTTDRALADDLRAMTNFGFGEPRHTTMAGLNGKLSEVGAVLARAKLEHLDEIVDRRHVVANLYRELLPPFVFQELHGTRHANQFVPVHLPGVDSHERDAIVDRLAVGGIQVAQYFSPHLAEQKFFAGFVQPDPLLVSNRIANGIVSLPLYDDMEHDDAAEIAAALLRAYEETAAPG